jgi:hypothetical protein
MGEFEYLSVLISIILGLAITQILTGYRGLVLCRARVRAYWPSLIWTVVLLLVAVQSWWSMFGLRNVVDWSFADFAVVLAQTVVLYLLTGLVLPEFFNEPQVDLREHYLQHRQLFFGGVIMLVAVSLAKDVIISGRLPSAPNVAFQVVMALAAAGAMATTRPWYHLTLAPATLASFLAYIAALFARLA